MSDFLNDWLSGLLENRADKRWTPKLYARPDVMVVVHTIAGVPVRPDETVRRHIIEVRGEVYDEAGKVVGEEVKATNTAPMPPVVKNAAVEPPVSEPAAQPAPAKRRRAAAKSRK